MQRCNYRKKFQYIKRGSKKIGNNVFPLVWDASQVELVDKKIKEASEIMGGFDIIVNNAGILSKRGEWGKEALLSTTVEEWENTMKINTSSIFFTMQAAVKYMLENNIKGNILNITSVAGYEPVFGAYGASKIASTALTKGWGKMFADDGITINGIAPGPVATEMNNWHEGDSMNHDRIPFGRFSSIDEIANLAMYLLSKEAEMVCKETVVLDGVAYNAQLASVNGSLDIPDLPTLICEDARIASIKMSQDKKGIIIRINEYHGKDTKGTLVLPENIKVKEIYETDLKEDKVKDLTVCDNKVNLDINHFEIKTVYVKVV